MNRFRGSKRPEHAAASGEFSPDGWRIFCGPVETFFDVKRGRNETFVVGVDGGCLERANLLGHVLRVISSNVMTRRSDLPLLSSLEACYSYCQCWQQQRVNIVIKHCQSRVHLADDRAMVSNGLDIKGRKRSDLVIIIFSRLGCWLPKKC